jgi:Domain of unknown function (DUF4105)
MGRVATVVFLIVVGLIVLVLTGWGALVLYYLAPGSSGIRTMLAWCFAALGVVTVGALIVGRARTVVAVGFAIGLLLVVVVWRMATPSNSRDWQPEVAVLPYAVVNGDRVTVHNIRNFDYRTETDFTPAYYDRTFDLQRLKGVDLLAVYWMGPAIAHLFVSFDFGDDHLAISVEARKDRTKPYATIPGFFRQYELVYIVADERDVIRVRTNYRKSPPEEVYLFRVAGTPDRARRLFLDYIKDINELRQHPRFYNTLTTNCTTMILAHSAVNVGHVPYSWKIMLSGYAPEYAYERGRLDQKVPFEELMRRSHINAAAQAADKDPDFSKRIRANLP